MIRQQGYMLAQIVAEIHAPDHAVGEVSGEGEAVIVEGVGFVWVPRGGGCRFFCCW